MLQTLDIVILLALALGLVRGLMTGAVRQVISLIGILISVVLAVELMDDVGRYLGDVLGITGPLQPLAGLLTVFLILQVVFFFVIRAVEKVIHTLRLSVVNRMLGGAVGVVKAMLVLSLIFIGLAYVEIPGDESREQSALYTPVASSLPAAWDFVATQLPRVQSLSEKLGEEVRGVLEGA